MNAKELMIWDIVAYNGCVCRIYSIHGREPRNNRFDCKEYVTLQCDGLIDVGVDEVQPIELTAEILEANGFEKINNHYYRLEISGWYITISIRCELVIIRHDNYNKIKKTSIQYVHELQHALRLCGLSELEDNFKI